MFNGANNLHLADEEDVYLSSDDEDFIDNSLDDNRHSIGNDDTYIHEHELKDFYNFNIGNKNDINIMHVNCRSIKRNFDDFKTLLSNVDNHLTAIAVSETWLTPDVENMYNLNGYKLFCNSRLTKIGGGVALYVNSNLSSNIINDMSITSDNIETIFIQTEYQNKKIVMGCIYRPPNTDINNFNKSLSDILNKLNRKKQPLTFIAGDFNIDIKHFNTHPTTADFLNIMSSFSFIPTIKKPTRITSHSATVIDNIFVNNLSEIKSGILYNDLSDHLPVLLHMPMKNRDQVAKQISKRIVTPQLIEEFNTKLNNVDWDHIIVRAESDDNVNDIYREFLQIYSSIFEKCFPVQILKFSKNKTPRHEYITPGLLRSCHKKSVLYKKQLRHPTDQNKEKYIKFRNKLKTLLQKVKKNYYSQRLQFVNGNIHETWKILNSVINKAKRNDMPLYFIKDNLQINSPSDIAKHFNDYFSNIGTELANSIPVTTKQYSSYLRNSPLNSFSLYLTDTNEIADIVTNLNNKVSCGVDDIPLNIMKQSIHSICSPLSAIVNCSFRTGLFPNQLKIAKICPIFKAGNSHEFSNYRPISVLPSFSKVFEKAAYNRLQSFLNKECILNCNQYGFRAKHSTYMALLDMYDKISDAIDQNKYSVGVFIDLSKAFDTIDHKILCCKLEHYGVRGLPLRWFADFLSNRKQCVNYNNVLSNFNSVVCGVPQGSILGPLLFILYVNDMNNCSDILKFILFADDTNLFYSCNNLIGFQKTIDGELDKLNNWFQANKLSLNIKKTTFMLFGRKWKNVPDALTLISIDGKPIERVTSTKFLGVYIDNKLTWQTHISQLAIKVSRNLGVLNKAKSVLSTKVLKMLYFSMVHSYLTYGIIIWGNACETKLNRIYILQKRAMRIISHCSYRSSTNSLFIKYNILKVKELYKIQALLFTYKSINNIMPISCMNHIQHVQDNYRYQLRKVSSIRKLPFRTNTRQRYIGVSGPRLWESLPNYIKLSNSLQLFKTHLQKYYFQQYFKC